MLIRLAAADELEDVLRLRLAFIADFRGVEPDAFDPAFVAATRAYLLDVEAQGRIRCWFACDAGDPAPVAVLSLLRNDAPPLPEEPLAHEGYIVNLYVAPACPPKRGLARAPAAGAALDAGPS